MVESVISECPSVCGGGRGYSGQYEIGCEYILIGGSVGRL